MQHTREWFNTHRSNGYYGAQQPCQNCSAIENIQLHHIVPLSLGGTNHKTNVVWLCGDCHGKLHNRRYDAQWKAAQMAGIRKAQAEGKFKGRTPLKKPDNWDEVIESYLRREITRVDAAKLVGISRPSFNKYYDEWSAPVIARIRG